MFDAGEKAMSEGRRVYEVEVPESDRTRDAKMVDGTPEAYRVVMLTATVPVCMIYGLHCGEFVQTTSTRWLVRHLLESIETMRVMLDDAKGYAGEPTKLK